MITPSDLEHWLSVAEEAARLGTEALAGAQASGRAIAREEGREVKIAADTVAETVIIDHLRRASPFPIVTEERGAIGECEDGGLRWIVDPLDGSFNYARQIPLFVISIALCAGDESLLGVVSDPVRSEVFTGVVGVGAWLNGVGMATSAVMEAPMAALCTGFPVATDFSTDGVTDFVRRVQVFKKIRMFGTAALSLAFVASGRVDAYQEDNIKIWDVAAGLALVRAAGGTVFIKPGRDALTRMVLATNGRLEWVV